MSRKLVAGILIIAIAAMSVTRVLMLTWTSCTIHMHAGTASVVNIGQFSDCACTMPIDAWDWDGITQGNTYELHVFVKNTGTEGIYLTYLPTVIEFYDGQATFIITVTVIEKGLPCQLYLVDPQFVLPEKDIGMPAQGFWLEPGKVVKVDIQIYVAAVVSGGVYDWDFTFYGAAM